MIEISYYGDFEDHHHHGASGEGVMESPAGMLVPLLIVSAGLIVVGLCTGGIVSHLIDPLLMKHGF